MICREFIFDVADMAQKLRLLVKFIVDGDDERFSLVLRKMHNVDIETTLQPSALHYAALYNRVDMAAKLLSRNANMNLVPILVSLEENFIAMQSSVKLPDNILLHALRVSPVRVSVLTRSKELQKVFFRSIDTWTYSQKMNVLDFAILFGNVSVTDLIMKHGGTKMERMLETKTPSLSWAFSKIEIPFSVRGKLSIDFAKFSVEHYRSPVIARLLGNIILEPKMFRKLKKIIRRYPSMLWHRENKQYTGARYTTREKTGNTPLAVLLHTIQGYHESVREKSVRMQSKEFLDIANTMPAVFLRSIVTDLDVMKQNINVVSSSLEVWIWYKMVKTLRLAMGMATHRRLGGMNNCFIRILGNDNMDMIFEMFFETVSEEQKMYMVS